VLRQFFIVPDSDKLVVKAKIAPHEIDQGLEAAAGSARPRLLRTLRRRLPSSPADDPPSTKSTTSELMCSLQ
jgi:hypothetical protein